MTSIELFSQTSMTFRKSFFFIFLLMAFTGFGQGKNTPEQDEELAKQKRIYERDPQKYRDSLQVIRTRQMEEKAQVRLASYQSNTRIDTLKSIDLSNCKLTVVPEFVTQAKALSMLILDYNSIRTLPKELVNLDSLKKLYWRNNDLANLKPKWKKLTQIEKLGLDGNGLSKIPSMKRFPNLEILELKQNQFEEIPINKLKKNVKLKELSIGENPLKLSKTKYDKIGFLKTLKINKSNLTDFDASLYSIASLEELQMQENKLKSLPDGISRLTNLVKFSGYKNEITSLPADFWSLQKLEVIDLYYNQLEVIPAQLEELSELRLLYLSHNRIFTLPAEIGNLTRLQELYLHHNRLSVLPSTIQNLDSLQVIRVNENYLTEFPNQFIKMPNLREIDVNTNALSTLPAEIEEMEFLKYFNFSDNEIELGSQENAHVPYMIERMLKRGVTCIPRIYRSESDESAAIEGEGDSE